MDGQVVFRVNGWFYRWTDSFTDGRTMISFHPRNSLSPRRLPNSVPSNHGRRFYMRGPSYARLARREITFMVFGPEVSRVIRAAI